MNIKTKILFYSLITLVLAMPLFATGTKAKSIRPNSGLQYAIAVADASSGYCAGVDENGYLQVEVVGGISGSFTVTDVSVTSLVPGVAATSLGKAEDAGHSSGDTGVGVLAVRNDTLDALAGSDGDYAPLQVDASGSLYTTNISVKAEDSAHTTADGGVAILSVRADSAATTSGTDGDYSNLITDASGQLWVNAGAVTPGVAAGNLGKAEDAAHTSADVGVAAAVVRKDVAASFAGTDGDYTFLQVDATGYLRTTQLGIYAEDAAHNSGEYGIPAVVVRKDTAASLAGTDGDNTFLQTNATGYLRTMLLSEKAEDVAHTTADSVIPMGVVRKDTAASLCGTDGDYSIAQVDALGSLRTVEKASQVYDTTFASGMYGSLSLAVRRDADTTIASEDGKSTPLQVNAGGQLKVELSNIEKAEDASHTTADLLLPIATRRIDVAATSAGTSADYATLNTDSLGAVYVNNRKAQTSIQCATGDAAGGLTVRTAAGAGVKSRIYKITVSSLAAETITVTELSGFEKIYTTAGNSQVIDFGFGGLLQTTANTAITFTSGDASACQVVVEYTTE